MKTLLIAASGHARKSLMGVLKRRKHEVTVVENAEAASTAAQSDSYGLVVLEADGLHGAGPALCRRLREVAKAPHCMILAAVESPQPEHVEALLAAGADDFLTDLDDTERLELRLTVAEHHLGGGETCRCWRELPSWLRISSCPVLRDAPCGVFRAGIDGKFMVVNPALVSMLAYESEEELLNVAVLQDLYQDPAGFRQTIAELTDHGHLEGVEFVWKRKDGIPITVLASGRAVREDTGGVVQIEGMVYDITEQKRTQESLKAAQERLEYLVSSSPAVIYTCVPESGYATTFITENVTSRMGYEAREFTEDPRFWADRIHPEDAPRIFAELPKVLKTGHHAHEYRFLHGCGSYRWMRDELRLTRDASGRPLEIIGYCIDITERKQARQTLAEELQRSRSILETSMDGFYKIDPQGRFLETNPSMCAILGYTRDELLSMDLRDVEAQENPREITQHIKQVIQSGLERFETQHRRKDGKLLDVEISVHHCKLSEDEFLFAFVRDITEQKGSAKALQKEQQLLRRLLDLHEKDRRLIAYEIHDGYAQYLTGALYNLQGFRELQEEKPADAGKTFDEGLSLIHRGISEARRLISGLRPPILDEFGIVAAIEYLVCETQESGAAEIDFVHDAEFQELASPLKSSVFRIVQESLTNACRHSQSDKIRIELQKNDGRIFINVRDWGIGFDPDEVEEHRFGLQGIRERARLLGGHAVIETAPDRGTLVSVQLPLVEAAGEPPESQNPH